MAYVFELADVIPTEGLLLKDWVRQTFGIQVSVGITVLWKIIYISIEKSKIYVSVSPGFHQNRMISLKLQNSESKIVGFYWG